MSDSTGSDRDEAAVVVVAMLKVRPGMAAEAIEAFRPVVEKTHDERGCLAYALHRDTGDPDTIVLIEKWASQEDLDQHFVKPYVEDLGEMSAELLAEPPQIVFCEPIDLGDPDKGRI